MVVVLVYRDIATNSLDGETVKNVWSTGWAKLNDTNLVFDVVLKNALNNCDDFWEFK